jgi:ubiquitin C-terminal hydrolase
MSCIYTKYSNDLSKFKLQLARYNRFFDGSCQRDAYECLIFILTIINIGTKERLVIDDMSLEDDQYSFSLSKRLFGYIYKQELQCIICRYLTTSYKQSYTHFVYPSEDTNIKSMLDTSMTSILTRKCGCCKSDTKHHETIEIAQPPNIFTIVINRFNLALAINKNRNKIILDREILVFSNRYILVGSIHHHGSTITSGHYTANVYCAEYAYTCNDNHIIPLNYLDPSDSVYMAFYAHSSHLSQQNQRMGLKSHGTGTGSA